MTYRAARLRVRIKGTSRIIALVQPRTEPEKHLADCLGELLQKSEGASGYFACVWDEAGWSDSAWVTTGFSPAFVAGVVSSHMAELAARRAIHDEAQRYE